MSGLKIFEAAWAVYRAQTEGTFAFQPEVEVDGRTLDLMSALHLVWNCTEQLPNALRAQVIAEVMKWKTMDKFYWEARIWRVSQAARILRPIVARRQLFGR